MTIGIPHGSGLGPLLLNILINNLFLMKLSFEICNTADENTLYSCRKGLSKLLKWFVENGDDVSWIEYAKKTAF